MKVLRFCVILLPLLQGCCANAMNNLKKEEKVENENKNDLKKINSKLQKKVDILILEKENLLNEKRKWFEKMENFERNKGGLIEEELEKIKDLDGEKREQEIIIEPLEGQYQMDFEAEEKSFYNLVNDSKLASTLYDFLVKDGVNSVDKKHCIKLYKKLIRGNKMGLRQEAYKLYQKKRKKKKGILGEVVNFATSGTGRALFNALISENKDLMGEISKINELREKEKSNAENREQIAIEREQRETKKNEACCSWANIERKIAAYSEFILGNFTRIVTLGIVIYIMYKQ